MEVLSTAVTHNAAEQQALLGRILGLDRPVSMAVLRGALESDTYANNLLTCRRDPDMLQHLLDHPPRPKGDERSLRDLLGKGFDALLRFAGTGFSTVDDMVHRQRLAGCRDCAHLTLPPGDKKWLYAAVGVPADFPGVCGRCGCAVALKTRMTSEQCPEPMPGSPHLTRWGEPRDAAKGP